MRSDSLDRLFYKVVRKGLREWYTLPYCNPSMLTYKKGAWTRNGHGVYLYRTLKPALQLLEYLRSQRVLGVFQQHKYVVIIGIAGSQIKRDRTKSEFLIGVRQKIDGSEYLTNKFKPIGELKV